MDVHDLNSANERKYFSEPSTGKNAPHGDPLSSFLFLLLGNRHHLVKNSSFGISKIVWAIFSPSLSGNKSRASAAFKYAQLRRPEEAKE